MGISPKFNSSTKKPLVLLSPLDWGLGHTTRCIPLIKELLSLECNVIIACNSIQKALLSQEFPDITYIYLEGYNIRYGKSRWSTFINLLLQGPKILIKIKEECRWLRHFLTIHRIDAIISDNRFGLFAAGVPAVFITHQLQIKTGFGRWADTIVRRWNYHHIKHFTACWVPDNANSPSMAGELSHPKVLPALPVHYIGCVSRFERCFSNSKGFLLIILSGPEPQRSIFESLLLQQVNDFAGDVILVRGLLLSDTLPVVPDNCTVYNHVAAADLFKLICSAALVVSRCGYTTVMDLLKLQKKCILVPTPGQAEQEYLAFHLRQELWAFTTPQKNFSLLKALADAELFPFRNTDAASMEGFKPVLAAFVESL